MEEKNAFEAISSAYRSVDQIIYYTRMLDYDKANTLMIQLLDELVTIMDQMAVLKQQQQVANLSAILESIMSVYQNKDYILVADLLELQLLPALSEMQMSYIGQGQLIYDEQLYDNNLKLLRDKNSALYQQLKASDRTMPEQGYEIEYSGSGAFTIAVTDQTGRYYMHSNKDAAMDGPYYFNQFHNGDCDRYIIYGLGLGYHIQNFVLEGGDVPVDIYESDINIIKTFMKYENLRKWFCKEHVTLHYDPELKKFCQDVGRDEAYQLVIHQPSLRHIQKQDIKKLLESIYLKECGIRSARLLLQTNYRSNTKLCHHTVDELSGAFKDKDVYIIAAGPSLDKNIDQLKEKPDNAVILATGTVFRKLMEIGIAVDYVIILDANEKIINQIEGFEDAAVPMLLVSTAYKGFVKQYQGEKYLIMQNGFAPAEQYAAEHGLKTFSTGGSVSTIAMDVCIRMQCKKVVFLGLDLAYTNNLAHATATSRRDIGKTDTMVQVPATNGGTVPSSNVFISFIQWFEHRLKEKDVTMDVIDATEGGAIIKGMKIQELKKAISCR